MATLQTASPRWQLPAALALALGVLAVPAWAQTGTLDVFLEVPEGSPPLPELAGYDVMLRVKPPSSGLALVDAIQTEASGEHPPIFPSGSPMVFPDEGDSLQVSDFLLSGGATIGDGQGLFSAEFAITSGTVGTFAIEFDPAWTALSDLLGQEIPYVANDGAITVLAGGTWEATPPSLTVLPEPTTWLLLLAGGLWRCRRRRETRRRA